MASIDHALWFHRALRVDDWLLYAMESPSASGARGFARASVFARDGGWWRARPRKVWSAPGRIPEPPQAATVMAALLGVLFAAAAADGADVEALQRLWSGCATPASRW